MRDSDLILSQIRQRLEILYQMVYELENEGGGGGGSSNYNELSNKPSINNVTLSGNKTSSDLGLQSVISDLSTIRSDAALGATAVQPATMEEALSGKQNNLTFDDAPEVGSSNPVKSGGIYTALLDKVDTEVGKGLSTNDFTDAYKDGLIDIVDSGAKNRIKVDAIGTTTTSGSTYTNNGTTFTLNADGSITCTGDNDNTADSSVRLLFDSAYFNAAPYCNGEYILSGSPADASDTTYFCSCYGSGYNYKDTGSGIVLPSTATATISVYITVKKGKSADGKTFYPMICRKEAYDVSKAYRPYVPSNQELYAMIQAL